MKQKHNLVKGLAYQIPKYRLTLVREGQAMGQRIAIKTPADASDLLEPLRHAAEEYFISLHLNAKHEVIGIHEVSHGTLSSSLVHPREVFKAAIIGNSYAILVCHNHPSGSTVTPSLEDLETTRQLLNAGRILGVSVIDHLIVGAGNDDSLYSIREQHSTLWGG